MPVVINGSTGISGIDGTASSPAIEGGDTNTGMFFPAADTVAFATNGNEELRIGPAGQIGIAGANYGTSGQVLTSAGSSASPSWSAIPAPDALSTASGSAPSYSARAWVNFNGTGTVAIRASGNVTSITDNGTGDYTINITTAMSDANYNFVGMCRQISPSNNNDAILGLHETQAPTTTTIRVTIQYTASASVGDSAYVCVSLFR